MGRAAAETIDASDPAMVNRSEPSTSTSEVAILRELELSQGDRAGDFVVESLVGRGSFGTVYAGAHAVIGRRAAIKVLRAHADDDDRVAAFVNEARLVARLRHPNIVDVLTYGRLEDGRHFQVMELIEGPTLADHLRERGALSMVEALPILRGIAQALDAVHASGIAHRDLKPANVVLERRDGELIAKLIDFGIAELVEADDAPGRRSIGTPRYMSPEQCRGEVVDAQADIYAFGLLAYELLTGRPPFAGSDAVTLMLQHTSHEPLPLSAVRPALSSALDPIVLEMLAKDPAARPTRLVAVVDRLAAITTPHTPRARTVGVAIGATLLLVGAAAVVLSQGKPTSAAAPSSAPTIGDPHLAAPLAADVADASAAPTTPDSTRDLAPATGVAVSSVGVEAPQSKAAPLPRGPVASARQVALPTAEPDLEAPESPFGGTP